MRGNDEANPLHIKMHMYTHVYTYTHIHICVSSSLFIYIHTHAILAHSLKCRSAPLGGAGVLAGIAAVAKEARTSSGVRRQRSSEDASDERSGGGAWCARRVYSPSTVA